IFIVEWLLETRHVTVPLRYRTNRAGYKEDRIGSLQQNIGDLKRRIAIQPHVENGAVNLLAPEGVERVSNAAERPHRLAAKGADQFLQLHGNKRFVFDQEQSSIDQRPVRLAGFSPDLVAHHRKPAPTATQSR